MFFFQVQMQRAWYFKGCAVLRFLFYLRCGLSGQGFQGGLVFFTYCSAWVLRYLP